MIDIHCHILYGIDDGAKDLDESLAMAKFAYEDGIRQIIATPHFTKDHMNDKKIIRDKVVQLQQLLDKEQIPIKIHAGNEVRIESAAFIYEHTRKKSFHYLGNKSKFILLEQTWHAYNADTMEVAQWFMNQGIQPIIPHPERHSFFREQPGLLIDLIQKGCWTQVSVDSLLGKNTEDARLFAEWLVQHNCVHVLATDAHNIDRKPVLSVGYQIIESLAGIQRVEEMHSRLKQIL